MRPDPAVGLCSVCRFSHVQESAKGSHFWRCLRADDEARFMRYPPLPVTACPGHAARAPYSDGSDNGNLDGT